MSMFTCKILDGYVLNTADGYSANSPWIDLHSSPFFSISVAITGTPTGGLTLQQSNDQNSAEAPRGLVGSAAFVAPALGVANDPYPVTAGSPYGTPTDGTTVVLSGQVIVGGAGTVSTNSVTVSAAGVTNFTCSTFAARWVRLVYTETSNAVITLDAWMHRKSQIGTTR